MHDTWKTWGVSVMGPFHKKVELPNQDAWIARQYAWGTVVAVSDGLGSKAHSDHGARAACLAVCEAAQTYQQNPTARFEHVLQLIHSHWLVKIAPFSSNECGATCLFAILRGETITLGRLGDGMIAVLGSDERTSCLVSDNKEDSFSNYTQSLRETFKAHHWQTVTVESAHCDGILLCTDGISDDLKQDMQLAFAREVYNAYAKEGEGASMSQQKRKRLIKRWLHAWPVPGHSDDKTMACLFKTRG